MEIKKFREHIYTTYENLKEGEVFKIAEGSKIFMKVNDEQCVCFNSPEIVHFHKNYVVRKIKAVLQLMED